METWIVLLIGIVVGSVITGILEEIRTAHGVLKIDHSNPEKDVFRFELKEPLDQLEAKTRIAFKIDNGADLSQK